MLLTYFYFIFLGFFFDFDVICALDLHARPKKNTAGKHVVFGRVIRGFDDVVSKIAQVSTDEKDRPAVPVIIFNCGELELRRKAAPPRSSTFRF